MYLLVSLITGDFEINSLEPPKGEVKVLNVKVNYNDSAMKHFCRIVVIAQ